MYSIYQDLRFGIRTLMKSPGFTCLSLLMLAVGIGVNSLVFSVIDSLFLRSLPVQNPEQFIRVYVHSQPGNKQRQFDNFSYPEFQDIRHQSSSISDAFVVSKKISELDVNGNKSIVPTEYVSSNFFSVLGLKPAVGKVFSEAERWNFSDARPIVISHKLWQKQFGADPAIAGKTVFINRRPAVILGVTPYSFTGIRKPTSTEMWLPFEAWGPETLHYRKYKEFELLFARLKPGTNIENARAELNTISRRLALEYPETNAGISYFCEPAQRNLWELWALAAIFLSIPFLILMICCINVSGMVLAKSEVRQSEIAVRIAMGSSRTRLLRQLLSESLLLATTGAALGLLLTQWLIGLQSAFMPPFPITVDFDLRVDARVFLFTFFISVVACLASGLAPAIRAIKTGTAATLKLKSSPKAGKLGFSFRNMLTAGQMAVALVLVIATGLLLKTLFIAGQVETGLDQDKNLLIVAVAPFSTPGGNPHPFFVSAVEKIKSIPGVKGATYAMRMPLTDSGGAMSCKISIPDMQKSAEEAISVKYNLVGRNYFSTVGTKIQRGREFNQSDELENQRAVLVSEFAARQFWPNTDPLGRFILKDGKSYEVVGIAQDVKISRMHEAPEPYFYFPASRIPIGSATIIIETAGDPLEMVAAVRTSLRSIGKTESIVYTDTLERIMGAALYQERMGVMASGTLGFLGITLSAIGLYGIISYVVRRRTNEIGIRIALGAQSTDVTRMVIMKGLKTSLIGICAGLILSFFAMHVLASLLYGVSPNDGWVFAASALLVLAVAFLASYIPAYRAAKIDPMAALRYE